MVEWGVELEITTVCGAGYTPPAGVKEGGAAFRV
jgi:hypothetical protein